MKLASICFILVIILGQGYVGASTPLDAAILSIRAQPIEYQVVFSEDGQEVARSSGDATSFDPIDSVHYAGATVLHNHPTVGAWYFSAQDYYFAVWYNVKRMVVVTPLHTKLYRVCELTRLGSSWQWGYHDISVFERKIEQHGADYFYRQWAKLYNLYYHCEDK